MITCQVETFEGFLEELKPLLPRHYEELALYKDDVPLDPDFGVYLEKERQGQVLVLALRESGNLVGYFIGFIAPHLHYRATLACTMDIFYVAPEWRGHGAGSILFRELETELRRRRVRMVFLGSKLHKDVSGLFEKLGYKEVERYYSKYLGEE